MTGPQPCPGSTTEDAVMVAIHPMPRLVVAAAIALLTVCRDTASAYSNDGVAALIDKLPGIANGDLGYMPTRSGGGFLPLAVSRPGAMLLFQLPPTKSEALRELVERGAAAVPDLIAHLDDKRPTKIELKFE